MKNPSAAVADMVSYNLILYISWSEQISTSSSKIVMFPKFIYT